MCGTGESGMRWIVKAWRRGAGSCTNYPLGGGSVVAKRASEKARASGVRYGPGGRRDFKRIAARARWVIVQASVGEGDEEESAAWGL